MRAADRLMYRVKGSGTNTFAHDVWPAPARSAADGETITGDATTVTTT